MLVRDIMSSKTVCVSPETKLTEVADLLFRNRFHGAPVVEKGRVVGIVTETDFFVKDPSNIYLPSYISFIEKNKVIGDLPEDKREKVAKLLDTRVKDIMSNNCVSILRDMRVDQLIEFFKTTKFKTLPVTDENEKLVGIVTRSDVIGLMKT